MNFCKLLKSDEIGDETKESMFEMYKKTYSTAKQDLWFKSTSDLFRYPCGYAISCFQNENDGLEYIRCYIMFQLRKSANKISLLCHDSTQEGKDEVMLLINNLLHINGWILEASGATSWVLRSPTKQLRTPYFVSQNLIETLLDIDPQNEKIIINENFNYEDKNSYYYTHQYYKDGKVMFENHETLFGVGGCNYSSQKCDRKCKK